jgi:hypothetical protein
LKYGPGSWRCFANPPDWPTDCTIALGERAGDLELHAAGRIGIRVRDIKPYEAITAADLVGKALAGDAIGGIGKRRPIGIVVIIIVRSLDLVGPGVGRGEALGNLSQIVNRAQIDDEPLRKIAGGRYPADRMIVERGGRMARNVARGRGGFAFRVGMRRGLGIGGNQRLQTKRGRQQHGSGVWGHGIFLSSLAVLAGRPASADRQ